jgi:hypothetical protein
MALHRFILAAPVALLLAAGCSSAPTRTPAISAPTAPAASTASSSPASAAPAAPAGLSGKWSGQYGGSYSGTFILRWHQDGSKLSGTIRLSAPATTMPIHGTVNGCVIRFGTVGSVGITYSGSVSGNSMSGSYQVASGNGAGGHWSAARVS